MRSRANSPQEPIASRPHMPGYGIAPAEAGKLLAWKWARVRLEKARTYWYATVREQNRERSPHLMPVWGVWLDDTFYFSTGFKTRKAQNLARNPRCAFGCANGRNSLIVEGDARKVAHGTEFSRASRAYRAKYGMGIDPKIGYLFAVRPRVAFAFSDSEAEFTATATRWQFP